MSQSTTQKRITELENAIEDSLNSPFDDWFGRYQMNRELESLKSQA